MSKGERLRKLREKSGLSQTEAAEKIGVSKQTLYKYEKDLITNIPSNYIEKMADIYDTTPDYIMGWDINEDDLLLETHYSRGIIKEAIELYYEYLNADPQVQSTIAYLLSFARDRIAMARSQNSPDAEDSKSSAESPDSNKDNSE